MASPLRRPRSAGILLVAALLLATPDVQVTAQVRSATPSLPLTHAPIDGLDPHTLVLGQFESTQGMTSPGGSTAVKTTFTISDGGIFGTHALRIISSGGVAIHRLIGFDPAQGTIEMWVRPGSSSDRPQYLFSLEGRRSLDGDAYSDLIVGETNSVASTNDTIVYFGTPTGLDLVNTTTIETATPRGIGLADFDADGNLDLVIANNQGNTLVAPVSTPLGEIQMHLGPFVGGQDRNGSDLALEVDEPQGLVVADYDQQLGPDFAVASYRTVTPAVIGYTNDGLGALTPSFATLGIEHVTSAEGLSVGDVNGDGVLDLLYGSFSAQPSYLMIGNVTAGVYDFPNGMKSDRSNETLGVSIADVSGDGWPDAVLAQPLYDNGPGETPGSIAIHVNDGDGGFASSPDIRIMSPRPFTVSAVKDIDNDGHLDILVANWRFGPVTTTASTAYLGPFAFGNSTPPSIEFLVDDAVSMAMGDLDNDGIDDVFLHSSTANASPVYLLDENGVSKAGVDEMGRNLPSYTLASLPTAGNTSGEGAGAMVAQVGGTTTYGSHLDRSNSFELYAEDGMLIFVVTDNSGVPHTVSAPIPAPGDPDSLSGFNHVQAEWSGAAGLVELRVRHPDEPINIYTTIEAAPFTVGAVSPVFRLGSDTENQLRAAGWRIDDLRISDVRRSEQDADHDGWQDNWDNCPQLYNPLQADWNDDGIGDGCRTCQPDLGIVTAGSLTISLCGDLLRGGAATLALSGAPPHVIVLLLTGPVAAPRPFRGGLLVPSPVSGVTALRSDASGRLDIVVPGGTSGSEPELVILQALGPDANQPGGVMFSNALVVERLP
jgi:hypothetical protein